MPSHAGKHATDRSSGVSRRAKSLHVARESKRPGNTDLRGRSGAGLGDRERRRTRDGPTTGEWKGSPEDEVE
jgi:hypothetical protein